MTPPWTELPPEPTLRCRHHPRYIGHKDTSRTGCDCQLVRSNFRIHELERKVVALLRDREASRQRYF